MTRDVLTWWRSQDFVDDATAWVDDVLASHGLRRTGSLVDRKVRFWSANYAVPTDAGTCWFKALCPAMGHEVAVVGYLDRQAPGAVLTPLALDVERGWMLNVDGGLTMADADQGDDAHGLAQAVDLFGALQRRLESHGEGLLAAGVPRLLPDDVEAYLHAEVERLTLLPAEHPAHLSAAGARDIVNDLPHALRDMALLQAGPVAASLQHNDLHRGNIFAPSAGHEGYRIFDWGDSVWSHPFAVLRVPAKLLVPADATAHAHLDRRNPQIEALQTAYLQHWTDVAPMAELVPLVQAADRLGRLSQYRVWAESLRDADHAALLAQFDFIPHFEDQLRKAVRPRPTI